MGSPDSIKGGDGALPLPLFSLGSNEVFRKVVGEFAGFPHEGFILQVFTCYLLVNVLEANEECPVTEPEQERSANKIWRYGVAERPLARLIRVPEPSLVAWTFSGLPWGLRLGHPHEVHVASQQGEVRRVL